MTSAWKKKDYEKEFQLVWAGLNVIPKDARLKATLILRLGNLYDDKVGRVQYL